MRYPVTKIALNRFVQLLGEEMEEYRIPVIAMDPGGVLTERIERGKDRVDVEKLNPQMTDPAVITGGYVFSVLLQGVNPGAFINGLTILTGLGELVISEFKALLFGVMAGLVGCYRGLTVKGGPKGVGEAVNETVIYAFICLFVINVLMTAIGIRILGR